MVVAGYSIALLPQHAALLAGSAIPPELVGRRGYVSVDTKTRLEGIRIAKAGRNVPGLLIPLLRKDGSGWGWQYRPDTPRTSEAGRPVKYETPYQQRAGLDVPPGVGPLLDDPAVPLFITEGSRKADAAAALGLACVSLSGVDCWRGRNSAGGKIALPEWADVALNGRRVVLAFDGDVVRKPGVRGALNRLAGYLVTKDAKVEYLWLPDTEEKTGLDDWIAAGHGVEDLWALVRPAPPPVAEQQEIPDAPPETPQAPAVPQSLVQVHQIFRRWMGERYDLGSLDAVLAAAAAEQLDGDPPWLLLVGGPGNAKTETVLSLVGAGAHLASTIKGEAALLSGTPDFERTKNATGGLLRKIGDRGVLVIKDVTSILSMNRDRRAEVLAALREVYDGRWDRDVGTSGGFTLTWTGRLVVVGAVTTAWDSAHAVVAAMGDRFALVRLDSTTGRAEAGTRALHNVGAETMMRSEFRSAVGGLMNTLRPELARLTEDDQEVLLGAADLVTYARTAVERDYQGNVVEAHAPEMPTRFAKMLAQLARGGLALGMDHDYALTLAGRVARDSMPPLRLMLLADIAAHPASELREVVRRVQRPRTTVDRTLQELHLLGLLTMDEGSEDPDPLRGKGWRYSLTRRVDEEILARFTTAEKLTSYVPPHPPAPSVEETERSKQGGKEEKQVSLEEDELPAERAWRAGSPGEGMDKSGESPVPATAGINGHHPRCSCGRLLPPNHVAAGLRLCAPCTARIEAEAQ